MPWSPRSPARRTSRSRPATRRGRAAAARRRCRAPSAPLPRSPPAPAASRCVSPVRQLEASSEMTYEVPRREIAPRDHRLARRPLTEIARDLRRQLLVGAAPHQPERALHALLRQDAEKRRLPQLHVERFLQRVVEHRLARGVREIGDHHGVALGERARPARYRTARRRPPPRRPRRRRRASSSRTVAPPDAAIAAATGIARRLAAAPSRLRSLPRSAAV